MNEISLMTNKQPNRWMLGDALKKHGEMLAALISGLLILIGWTAERASGETLWEVFLAAYLIGGFAKAKQGFEDTIKNRSLNVELLMVLAAVGAACIGHWLEGAVLIFIFALSGALETYATERNARALTQLMALQPETARLVQGDRERMVSVKALNVGDLIRVKPGERIPADGVIVSGETTINESAITGESIAVFRGPDGKVLAGTVNVSGSILVRVTKKSTETLLSKILELVQTAQEEKVPSQLLIEKVESRYVQAVIGAVFIMLIAPPFALGWSWTETVYRAMVLLVVASPCALVASTMPAVLSAIAYDARQGLLIKGGVHLGQIATVKAIAFDKTGTITNGRPEVIAYVTAGDANGLEVLKTVAAVEHQSTHPLAEAIVDYAKEKGVFPNDVAVEHVRTVPGYGVEATVGKSLIKIGKPGFVDEAGAKSLQTIPEVRTDGGTTVYIEIDQKVVGCMVLKDTLRPNAKEALAEIHREGIRTIMLTGDNEKTAAAVAKEAGVSQYISECLPEDKATRIKELKAKYQSVAMIGDGINDTPALAAANVGIAMGNGTDAALETADIVLVKNDLSKIARLIRLSKKMNRIIKQNIAFAIGMIILLIINNLLGNLSMTLGVIGHEGSTLLVILNGLRLLRG
ncbi:heavy metal translocating P-type ATPase [Caenibacillus caldisaponilyticus]|uniref:heavy metal translocating P-type ATPase n=1 Tax=Caenibacillus caldisaponilyticus TaxID=1674942 RepID=UPI0009887B9A|nr:heavy metal translocating P-type ATPase [Caenibacillus caldisaponilyticus]